MIITVEQPAARTDWHAAMQPHIGHELAVDSAYQASTQTVLVQSVCYDGRMSAHVGEEWCPDLRMLPFFGTRQVTCRTCTPPEPHKHLYRLVGQYSLIDGVVAQEARCECASQETFSARS